MCAVAYRISQIVSKVVLQVSVTPGFPTGIAWLVFDQL